MSFVAIKRATLAAISLLLSLQLAQPRMAHSGTFQVNPIRITLSRQSSSSLLSVRNDSTEKIRFQIGVFAWDQNPKGEMVLNPTEDLIFYPTLLALEPGDERRIRIGTNDPIVASEKSYRIFVEELRKIIKPDIPIEEVDAHISEPVFALRAVEALDQMIQSLP